MIPAPAGVPGKWNHERITKEPGNYSMVILQLRPGYSSMGQNMNTALNTALNTARLAAALGLSIVCGSALAITFDCTKAANPDENTICSEVALSKIDDELLNNYKLVSANLPLPMRDYLKNSQGRWAASADSPRSGACKGDINCITAKYQARIAYLGNPSLRYEGVYIAKKARLSVASAASGVVVVKLQSDAANAQPMSYDQAQGLKLDQRVLTLPPPAENCAMRIEFGEGSATVYAKEAKKKACDGVKDLAGLYTRDPGAVADK
jgi:uncharacterized protein